MLGPTQFTSTILWALLIMMFPEEVEAFLTDRISYQDIPESDFTLRDLTEETVLQVAAKFLEEANPDRFSPGDLTQLDPLTPSTLFNETFGDCATSAKFVAAIHEIVEGNINVDRHFSAVSAWHFNAEQIAQSNSQMISLRNTILAAFNNVQQDYPGIRENIGRYLHLLQAFYSNTNWVELNSEQINTDLGIRNISDPLAGDDEVTCRNCVFRPQRANLEMYDCKIRINYNPFSRALFSGYRDGQDIAKPESVGTTWGKCSHGGENDDSRTNVATGGINKESSDPALSPHYYLHDEAVDLALRAGQAFFNDEENGVLAIIGRDKFQQLLNLQPGGSLVLVIDDTGSMSEEIAGVISTATDLVRRFDDTCLARAQYIVSPFNDPGYGPITVTSDPEACIAALELLFAHGGGDCPELCITGIEEALKHVIYDSKVYIWTDADEKDSGKLSDVLALAAQKGAELNFLVTGFCNSKRRKKRDISNSYLMLSAATGGRIYQGDDDDIINVNDIIIADAEASDVVILRWSSDNFTSTSLQVAVDNTMDELSITVSGPAPRGKTTLFGPSGAPFSFSSDSIEILVDTENVFTFLLDIISTGTWMLNIRGVSIGEDFEVGVSARSFLDFTYQMFEQDPDGTVLPIEGLPIAGSNVTLLIDIITPEMTRSVDALLLRDQKGHQVLVNSSLTTVGGRSVGLYVVDVNLPDQAFTVSVTGTDSDGKFLQRLRPAVVQVLGFKLRISKSNNTLGGLVPGGSERFGLLLDNLGASDTFDLEVSITTSSSSVAIPVTGNVEPSVVLIEEMGSTKAVVTLHANAISAVGDSVLVTITMISQTTGERNLVSQSVTLSEPIQVVEENTPVDLASPTCAVIEGRGSCPIDKINNNCQSHMWTIRVALQDDTALAEIFVSEYEESGGHYELDRSDAANIDVIYESNCCCPNVSVIVTDIAGKISRCGVDYLTPVFDEVVNVFQCDRDCDETTICQNGGICTGGRCDCAPGFNGTLCENDIDYCVDHACMNGGSCVDMLQGYVCDCFDTGFEGEYCEKDIDDCVLDSCKNGGKCVDELKGLHCDCVGTGFQSDTCEIDINECIQGVCLNGGLCTNFYGSFKCDCPPGWKGIECETNVNECEESNPCENNSTCHDINGHYQCVCLPGYDGMNCENDIDECASNPCQHSGTCINLINKYMCDCEGTGYRGIRCERGINECASQPCQNGGRCQNNVNGFTCKCRRGYKGQRCQIIG